MNFINKNMTVILALILAFIFGWVLGVKHGAQYERSLIEKEMSKSKTFNERIQELKNKHE